MAKKEMFYLAIIFVLSTLLLLSYTSNYNLEHQDKQQDNFTQTLPKMGQ
jgi:preprotein translocase subunit SecG